MILGRGNNEPHLFVFERGTLLPMTEAAQSAVIPASVSQQPQSIGPRYLRSFVLAIALWISLYAAATLITDPYGISPINVTIPHVNRYKPKLLDIDRLIKPYEVWRYQPRTVFLGTSRIQESIRPEALAGTAFAPAYNSAVPAATVAENVALLHQYIKLDPRLRTVFVELFLYAFMGHFEPLPAPGWLAMARGVMPLEFSSQAVFDSIDTWRYNATSDERPPSIAADGHWLRPKSWIPGHYFIPQGYANFVLGETARIGGLHLHNSALATLSAMQDFAEQHGVRVVFVVAPSYPWDDYRLFSTGDYDSIIQLYNFVARFHHVFTFAQINALTAEPVSEHMVYWNDPIHFSTTLGDRMLAALAGKTAGLPENFIRPIDSGTVQAVLNERLAGIKAWADANPTFVQAFQLVKALRAHGGKVGGVLNIAAHNLTVDGKDYRIVSGRGAIEAETRFGNTVRLSGWATDGRRPVETVAMTAGDRVVKQWFPTTPRVDIEATYGIGPRPEGFWFDVSPVPTGPWRVFGLTADGRAIELSSALPNFAPKATT